MVDYKRVPFDRALQFLSDRVVLPSETWQEQMGDAQNWAFTIAGITKASLLQEIQARTTKAIADGDSFEDFRADFERIMVKSGMSPLAPWRMRLIMLQNMRHSYNAGRYREQTDPETMRRRPWAIYRHDHPITPRLHHLALHGFTARISDPIWQTIYPVNGFNCFVANTPVCVPGGSRPIQSIMPGDLVYGGSGDVKPVLSVHKNWFKGQLIRIVSEPSIDVSATPNHRILTTQGWVEAINLRVGDELVSSALDKYYETEFQRRQIEVTALMQRIETVIDLEKHIQQTLQHYGFGQSQTTPDFRGAAPLNAFKSLDNFKAWALDHCQLFKISSLYHTNFEGYVYNLTVKDDHSYCVPFVVHNCRCAVRTIDQEEFDRDGHSASPPLVKDAAGMPVVNIDGKDVRVAERGFEFAPGANDTAYRGRVLADALRKMSPNLRREFMRVMGDRLPRPGQPVEPVNLPEPAPEPETKPKAKPGRAKTKTVRPEYKPEDTLWDERRKVAHDEFRRREAVWENAPPWVRNVISRIAPPGFIDPATVEDSNKKGAYHNLNGIHLNGWTPDKIQSGALWRHEYGHYIDRILGRRFAHRLNEIFQENPVDFISNKDSRFVKALATDNEKLITMKARTLELQASNVQKYLEKHRNKQGFIDTDTLETLEFAPTKASPAELVSTLDSAQLRRAHETIWFLERRNRDVDALVRRSPKVWQYFYEQFDIAKNAGNERIGVRSDFLAAMATQDVEFLVKWVYSLDKKWIYDAMDLVGSITRNAVSQGHSDDYYRIPGMSGTETIANIVDMVSQADIGEDFVRYLAPNTLRATRKIFEEFVKSGDFEFTGYINKDNPPKVFSDD